MKDNTEHIRRIISQYDGVEFIPLRVQDAFDPNWWNKRDRELDLSSIGVNLTSEGILRNLLPSSFIANNVTRSPSLSYNPSFIPTRISMQLSLLPPNRHRSLICFTNPYSSAPLPHCSPTFMFTYCSRHISYNSCCFTYLEYFSRRWIPC